MSRELVFLPAVGRDFIEGFDYYEALSPGRGGARFEGAYRQALQQVKAGLVTHFQPFEGFHRVIVPGFPYNLYYRLIGDRAAIAGLLYARFDPKRLEAMLRKRTDERNYPA